MRRAYRVRLVANLANGSTLAGILVAAAGRARLEVGPDGLLVAAGYRLPVPLAPAFCVGGVVVSRLDPDALRSAPALFRHEARHASQYAWCGGLPMVPLYFLAAGLSWLLAGDFYAWNPFERLAGLADGGYTSHRLRPALARLTARRPPPDLPAGRP